MDAGTRSHSRHLRGTSRLPEKKKKTKNNRWRILGSRRWILSPRQSRASIEWEKIGSASAPRTFTSHGGGKASPRGIPVCLDRTPLPHHQRMPRSRGDPGDFCKCSGPHRKRLRQEAAREMRPPFADCRTLQSPCRNVLREETVRPLGEASLPILSSPRDARRRVPFTGRD